MADNFTFKDAEAGTPKRTQHRSRIGRIFSDNIAVDAAGEPFFYRINPSNRRRSASAPARPRYHHRALLAGALIIYNNGSATIYLGASGCDHRRRFSPGRRPTLALEVGTLAIYGIAAAGTVRKARVMEICIAMIGSVSQPANRITVWNLTTTAKSTAVARINELDARIGSATSSSGSIGTSIDYRWHAESKR